MGIHSQLARQAAMVCVVPDDDVLMVRGAVNSVGKSTTRYIASTPLGSSSSVRVSHPIHACPVFIQPLVSLQQTRCFDCDNGRSRSTYKVSYMSMGTSCSISAWLPECHPRSDAAAGAVPPGWH